MNNTAIKKVLGSKARPVCGAPSSFTTSQRGGYLGKSNPLVRAEAMGFVRVISGSTGLGDASATYMHADGHVLTFSGFYGATKADNRFTFTLKLASAKAA